MIYLDNGATTYPKPSVVRSRMANALTAYGANPGRAGHAMSMRTGEAVYACRKAAAAFFHAQGPECVVFQPSCTQAVNTVLKGVLRRGDHVVVSDMEHNAVMRPLEKLKAMGVTYSMAKVYPENNDLTVNAFRQAITAETKLVVCTHASNVFGVRVPISRLAALAHAHGAKICVDCAQTAGVLDIDMAGWDIDYLCCAGHKGLYGPMGIGMLLLRQGDVIDTLVEGGTGTQSRELVQPFEPPERYESGTQNIPGIIGLHAGLEFVRGKGKERIFQHEMKLLQGLYEGLQRLKKIELYTGPPDLSYYAPVLSFNVAGQESEAVGEYLAGQGIAVRCGLHCAPAAHRKMGTLESGTVRVSPSAFSQSTDIQFLLEKLRRL